MLRWLYLVCLLYRYDFSLGYVSQCTVLTDREAKVLRAIRWCFMTNWESMEALEHYKRVWAFGDDYRPEAYLYHNLHMPNSVLSRC